jgi:hypothetical protein
MAVFAVSITKEINWRGGPKKISNVYHYKTGIGETFPDIAVIDKLVTEEKKIYASTVNFVRGRTWGPTEQGKSASKMREVKELAGSGNLSPSSGFYPEFAIMLYWPLGRYGQRNRPQYLRKWHHLGRFVGLSTEGARYNGVPQPEITAYMTAVESLNP